MEFVEKIIKNPDIPVVGKRVKRSENNVFKFCYEVHKILTYLFTGKLIKFGHFTCISKSVIKKMTNERYAGKYFDSFIAVGRDPAF